MIGPLLTALASGLDAASTVTKSKENEAIKYIKDNGLRAYAKHLQDQKIEELKEKAREEALRRLGLDEEKLAALENKMPGRAYETLLKEIESITDDAFETELKKNASAYEAEKQKGPLSHDPLPKPDPASQKPDNVIVNIIV